MLRSRAVVLCMVGALVAAGAIGASYAAAPAPAPAAVTDAGHPVTLRGSIQRVAVDGRRGPLATRTVLTHGSHDYDLTGRLHGVSTGDLVQVSGRLSHGHLDVSQLRLVRAARPVPLRRTARGVTRTLVVPVYWTAHAPAKPTRAQLKTQVLDYSRAWFRRVSNGRYSIKGTVAPWLRISNPGDCTDFFPVERNVYSHLKKKGINPAHYGRIIAYLPCRSPYIAGQASEPGHTVELYGYTIPQLVVHEQGHNLGLDHAGSLTCAKSGTPTVRDGHCAFSEYGDDTDTMGGTYEGFYCAPRRVALGWVHGVATVRKTATKSLVPYESAGHGLHAIRVRAGHSTYWLEYRTRTSFDKGLTPADVGLQVRLAGPRLKTRQLDLLPLKTSRYGVASGDGTALGVNGSWQTPEGVRFVVTKLTAGRLGVRVDFHPGRKSAPSAPHGVTLTPVTDGLTVGWLPPNDSHGAPVTAYRVTNVTTGHTQTVRPDRKLSLAVGQLRATRSYTYAVSAENEFGWGPRFTSAPATPLAGPPSAAIRAPDVAFGNVEFGASGTPNQSSGAPITSVRSLVDGQPLGTATAYDTVVVPTGGLSVGPHTFAVVVTDALGQTATASHTVSVIRVGLTVESPLPGDTVSDPGSVVFTVGNAAAVPQVNADVDNVLVGSLNPPVEGSNTVEVSWGSVPNGGHTLHVTATSADGTSTVTVSVPVTVLNP